MFEPALGGCGWNPKRCEVATLCGQTRPSSDAPVGSSRITSAEAHSHYIVEQSVNEVFAVELLESDAQHRHIDRDIAFSVAEAFRQMAWAVNFDVHEPRVLSVADADQEVQGGILSIDALYGHLWINQERAIITLQHDCNPATARILQYGTVKAQMLRFYVLQIAGAVEEVERGYLLSTVLTVKKELHGRPE